MRSRILQCCPSPDRVHLVHAWKVSQHDRRHVLCFVSRGSIPATEQPDSVSHMRSRVHQQRIGMDDVHVVRGGKVLWLSWRDDLYYVWGR